MDELFFGLICLLPISVLFGLFLLLPPILWVQLRRVKQDLARLSTEHDATQVRLSQLEAQQGGSVAKRPAAVPMQVRVDVAAAQPPEPSPEFNPEAAEASPFARPPESAPFAEPQSAALKVPEWQGSTAEAGPLAGEDFGAAQAVVRAAPESTGGAAGSPFEAGPERGAAELRSAEPSSATATDTEEGATSEAESANPAAPEAATAPESDAEATPADAGAPSGMGGPGDNLPPDVPATPPAKIDLEQWLGVRGAAALAGIALSFAAVNFFKYSIEHNFFPPIARVILGVIAGVGLIFAAEGPLKKNHRTLGNWLAGAGGAVLYLAFWAAAALYSLIPNAAAFVGMAAVTAACSVLAVRRGSWAIAGLAFIGGFSTPALLSTGSDRPIALFVYLALLNGALIGIARRKNWPLLPALSLVLTSGYQLLWFLERLAPPRVFLGAAIAGIFALLFSVFARPKDDEESGAAKLLWQLSRFGSIAAAFCYALLFASQSALSAQLWPTGLLLVALTAGATWMGFKEKTDALAPVAQAASAGVLFIWSSTHFLRPALAWQFAAIAIALLLIAAIRDERKTALPATSWVAFGLGWLWVFKVHSTVTIWPSMLFWLLGTLAAARQAHLGNLRPMLIAQGGLAAFGAAAMHMSRAGGENAPAPLFFLGLIFAGALLLAALPRWLAKGAKHHGERALGLYNFIAAGHLIGLWDELEVLPVLLFSGTLGLTMLISLRRRGIASWLIPVLTASAFGFARHLEPTSTLALAGYAALLAFYVLLPALAGEFVRRRPSVWKAAGFAPIAFAPGFLLAADDLQLGDYQGIVLIALSAFSLLVLLAAQRLGPEAQADPKARISTLTWPAAAALALITTAVPLQLENEWVTLAWALQGAALLALWGKLDHPGLKYISVGLFGVVALRLLGNPLLLDYHEPSGFPVLNWLAYTYLVPAAAMVFGAWQLGRLEVKRHRSWERFFGARAILSGLVGFTAIAIGFGWINVTVIDAFSYGREFDLSFERMPARDLSLSISWALYGLLLLSIGIWQKLRPLRALGTTLIAFTSLKVFLYDLGNLQDLWRVASLLGLALSLICVSFIYKRFVFRDSEAQ